MNQSYDKKVLVIEYYYQGQEKEGPKTTDVLVVNESDMYTTTPRPIRVLVVNDLEKYEQSDAAPIWVANNANRSYFYIHDQPKPVIIVNPEALPEKTQVRIQGFGCCPMCHTHLQKTGPLGFLCKNCQRYWRLEELNLR